MIVDLFAGPGGWDEGLRARGATAVGVEHDEAACRTRAAAGHQTIRADVAAFPIPTKRVEGLIASPPCPTFSSAGKGEGREQLPELHAHAASCVTGWQPWEPRPGDDPRTALVLEPLRFALGAVPTWIALEQVPPVLPLWETFAHVLRALGWSTWCGVLNAADYGVPQTRRRAVLMAHREREVAPPAPTHCRGGSVGMFGELAPWVSMAEALGWGEAGHRMGFPCLDDRGDSPDGYRERDWREGDEPAFALTEKARSWVVNTGRDWKPGGTRDDAQRVPMTEPAPAIDGKGRWHAEPPVLNPGATDARPHRRRYGSDEPAPTIAFGHDVDSWAWERPATTIAGDSRCWPPGHKINADDERRLGADVAAERYGDRAGTEAVKLTIRDALILQSFPPDYPVQGTKGKQFEQVGNAVPPLLARRILEVLL